MRVAAHLKRHSRMRRLRDATGTALHRGKDLAVAFCVLPRGLIRKLTLADPYFVSKERVSVRTSRLAPDGRYPLPFCAAFRPAGVRTFLYGLRHSGCLVQRSQYITYLQFLQTIVFGDFFDFHSPSISSFSVIPAKCESSS